MPDVRIDEWEDRVVQSQEKAGIPEEKIKAIGYYEYTRKKKTDPSVSSFDILIFDADDYTAGYGTVDRNGRVSNVAGYSYSATKSKGVVEAEATFSSDVATAFHDQYQNRNGFCGLIDRSLEEFNRRMRLYYQSDKLMNPSLTDIFDQDHDCDCKMIDKLFDIPRSRIGDVLSGLINEKKGNSKEIGEKRTDDTFDIDNCDIVIIGRAAMYYPVKYCIKEILSYDPLLSDKRFVSDAYEFRADEIAGIAAEEYEKIKDNIILEFLDRTGKQVKIEIPLPPQETGNKDYNGKYVGPVFISKGDKFKIEVNSQNDVMVIPDSIIKGDCDLIEIGAKFHNGMPILCIRRYEQPDRTYEISITE